MTNVAQFNFRKQKTILCPISIEFRSGSIDKPEMKRSIIMSNQTDFRIGSGSESEPSGSSSSAEEHKNVIVKTSK